MEQLQINDEYTQNASSVEKILQLLKELRVDVTISEYDLHNQIANILNNNKIQFEREFKIGNRSRVDFYINGIVLEIKKGKPYKKNVIEQLKKYASFESVSCTILVIEKNMDLPKLINSKPCISFGLNKLWGVAI